MMNGATRKSSKSFPIWWVCVLKDNYYCWEKLVPIDSMRHTHANVLEAKPVVNHQKVLPPILFALERLICDHFGPLWATSEQWQNESSEENQPSHRRHHSEISGGDFLRYFDILASLKPTDERVSHQHSRNHQKAVGVEGCHSEQNCRLTRRNYPQFTSIRNGFKPKCVRFVRNHQHWRKVEANSMHHRNVSFGWFHRDQIFKVLLEWKGGEPFVWKSYMKIYLKILNRLLG